MERTPQHGQMAVCASNFCPSSTSPVIDNRCAGTCESGGNSPHVGGGNRDWKFVQSLNSFFRIAGQSKLCASTSFHTRATRKRENVSFARRDGKRHRAGSFCLSAREDPIPEPALHHFSTGGAPVQWERWPRSPCPFPIPPP